MHRLSPHAGRSGQHYAPKPHRPQPQRVAPIRWQRTASAIGRLWRGDAAKPPSAQSDLSSRRDMLFSWGDWSE